MNLKDIIIYSLTKIPVIVTLNAKEQLHLIV